MPPADPGVDFLKKYPIIPDKAPVRGKSKFDANLHEVSALKMFGYTVGQKGWSDKLRSEFLTDFVEMELPLIVRRTFGDQFGPPLSEKRVLKVANVIAGNANMFLRNDCKRYAQAVDDWRTDLQFLKESYRSATGKMLAPWPIILTQPRLSSG